jgi:hypothetical protein
MYKKLGFIAYGKDNRRTIIRFWPFNMSQPGLVNFKGIKLIKDND